MEEKTFLQGVYLSPFARYLGSSFYLLGCFQVLPVMAQTKTVEGTVKDASGVGLKGITVSIKGGTGGTSTNANGVLKWYQAPMPFWYFLRLVSPLKK